MDQMKGMGMAPRLNPAFLQEMAAQGNAGAKQNMVSNKKGVICCICKNYHNIIITGNFFRISPSAFIGTDGPINFIPMSIA